MTRYFYEYQAPDPVEEIAATLCMSWNWIFRAVWMRCLEVNEMPRQMKESGVEWIGEIPCDWRVARLRGELREIKVKQFATGQTEQVLS